jgi:hypothetical protein
MRMNLKGGLKFIIITGFVTCLLAPFAARAEDAPKDWTISVNVPYASKYVWRGIDVVDAGVAQPSVSISAKGLALTVWGNVETTDENKGVYTGIDDPTGKTTEIDTTLSYSGAWKKLTYGLGAIHYDFPNTGFPETTELYASLGLAVPAAPTLTVYKDVDEALGYYTTLAVSHTFADFWKPAKAVSVSLALSGYAAYGSEDYCEFYFGKDGAGFTDAYAGAGLPVKLGPYFSLTPGFAYATVLDKDLRDGREHNDNAVWSVNAGLSF